MKLSLIIPTYKKEKEVCTQLSKIYNFLKRRKISFELIVVIDGLIDNTLEKIEKFVKTKHLKNIKILSYEKNHGKGYAVRYGMKKAKGEIIGFIDADTDIKMKSLKVALDAMKNPKVEVVVPSKFIKGSTVNMSIMRKVYSLGLAFIMRLVLDIPSSIIDPLCGLKLFRNNIVKKLIPEMKINDFAFDIEILNLIQKYGIRVMVCPFYAEFKSKSTVTTFKQIFRVLIDLLMLSYSNSKTSPYPAYEARLQEK